MPQGAFEMLQDSVRPGPLSLEDVMPKVDDEIPPNPVKPEGEDSLAYGGPEGDLGADFNQGFTSRGPQGSLFPANEALEASRHRNAEEFLANYLQMKAKQRELASQDFQMKALQMNKGFG